MQQEAESKAKILSPVGVSGLHLHRAALMGNMDEVKRLIEEERHNPLQVDKFNDNVLHYAVEGGHLNVIKYLIEEKGLVPSCPGRYGSTPLHVAALHKHLKLVQYFIMEHNLDSACEDDEGYLPLHKACQGGDIEVVQYLVEKMKEYIFLHDVVYGTTTNKMSPILLAAHHGHLQVVKFFVSELNCDPNTPGWEGRTPLHAAAPVSYTHLTLPTIYSV